MKVKEYGLKGLWIFFCLAMVGLFTLGMGESAQAATKKNTLVEVKPTAKEALEGYQVRYKYYNSKGKVTKNAWVTVKVDGVKCKMYFGSNGKAYQAPQNSIFYNNVKTYKIGKYTYGFDIKGRRVSGFVADAAFVNNQFFYFSGSGKLSTSKTKKFVKAISKGMKSGTAAFVKLVGKPSSVKAVDMCLGEEWEGELWTYTDLLQVQIKKKVETGETFIIAVSAAQAGL